MDILIASIEAAFPDLRWLIRSTEPGEDRMRLGAYFVHICNGDYTISFQGSGDTPAEALQMAFDKAKQASAA
jgi:hypothetical protein